MGFSLASLYSWCCCLKVDSDEGEYGDAKKSHPKEQQVDDAFGARSYVRDGSGQFTINNSASGQGNGQTQPTLLPLPELRPLEPLEPFKDMRRSIDPGGGGDPAAAPEKEDDGSVGLLKSWGFN